MYIERKPDMKKTIEKVVAAVVDAVIPPSLAELAERLRTARSELAEALKITPGALQSFHGLPDTNKVDASIDCCEKAAKVRDAELAFQQGDQESDEIFATLAETLSAKAGEARKLEAAVKAAQDALSAFDLGVEADVEDAEAARRALNIRRRAEDLPGAWGLPRDSVRTNLDLRSLLNDRDLTSAAALLRRPVPGRDPSQGDPIQGRINEIRRLDTERETKRALAAKPLWEDHDEWVAKWLSKDRAGRNEMEERGRELRAKASGYR
jgi:hypothetical protein